MTSIDHLRARPDHVVGGVRHGGDQGPVAVAVVGDLLALAEAVGAVPEHPAPPRVHLD